MKRCMQKAPYPEEFDDPKEYKEELKQFTEEYDIGWPEVEGRDSFDDGFQRVAIWELYQ
jgi:hypothetical protein